MFINRLFDNQQWCEKLRIYYFLDAMFRSIAVQNKKTSMKSVFLFILCFFALSALSVLSFGQERSWLNTWRVRTVNPGFNVLLNADKSKILAIIPNALGTKTTIQKSVRFPTDTEGLLNVEINSVIQLDSRDSCVFYVVAYRAGRGYLYYSKELRGNAHPGNRFQLSRFHYFPAKTDSLVMGFTVTGACKMSQINVDVDFVYGNEFLEYKAQMKRFAEKETNLERLATVCRLWGMLKYFSPGELNKTIDWDEVLLFALASNFKSFKDDINLDKIVEKLLMPYKTVRLNYGEQLEKGLLDKLQALQINNRHRKRIETILTSDKLGKSKYFTAPSDYPAPIFHEENIDNNRIPDVRSRLLSLFRYWNIIEYFYPYKNQLIPDWDKNLIKFLPGFILADAEISYNKNLLLLNASIGDGHTAVPVDALNLNETIYGGAFTAFPFDYSIDSINRMFVKAIKPSFSLLTGLKDGDELVSINCISTDSLIADLQRCISHPSATMKNIYLEESGWLNIFPFVSDSLKIHYRRGEDVFTKEVAWSKNNMLDGMRFLMSKLQVEKKSPAAPVLTFIDKSKTLIINPHTWNDSLRISTIMQLSKSSRLVIDLRTYPDWNFLNFCQTLIRDKVPLVKFSVATAVPGSFESSLKISDVDGLSYKKQIYVLISERTRSRAEFLATMLKSGAEKCILVGRRSAGADGNTTSIPMIGSSKINFLFSGVGVEFPNGIQTQQIGILPDITVNNNRGGHSDAILSEVFHHIEK